MSKEFLHWMGHPILHPDDHHELERSAAFHEFHRGLDRHTAEAQALYEYRQKKHAQAAAHHWLGMKAANAVANEEAARDHHAHYSAHMKQLGLDPNQPLPSRVTQHIEPQRSHTFKAHAADAYLPEEESIEKAESLDKMALKDIKPAPMAPLYDPREGEKYFDYSHVLPSHLQDKYTLRVVEGDKRSATQDVYARVFPKKNTSPINASAGYVEGTLYQDPNQPKGLHIDYSLVHPLHRGKGLGQAAYEALMAHAYHHHKIGTVSGGMHSTLASGVHQKLAQKHGFDYTPKPSGEKIQHADMAPGEFDAAHSNYRYAVKTELVDTKKKR